MMSLMHMPSGPALPSVYTEGYDTTDEQEQPHTPLLLNQMKESLRYALTLTRKTYTSKWQSFDVAPVPTNRGDHQYGSFSHSKIEMETSATKTTFSIDAEVSPPVSNLKEGEKGQQGQVYTKARLDLSVLVPGTVPHSVLVAATIGIACGVSAYMYNSALQWSLVTVWKTFPRQLLFSLWRSVNTTTTNDEFDMIAPSWAILWIPTVVVVLSIGLGWTVRYVGEPGDLASTIRCVHNDGWIVLSHAAPMILASLFSIVAGASVGPEAAVVAVGATLAGFISCNVFGTDPKVQRNLVRKHTLMGVGTVPLVALVESI
jgi:hypothetical protein